MMEEEEEVRLEVDAVQAVYGDDCCVIDEFPPHLTVHIVPRTAEDSSQQFVEAIIGIRTSAQYPKEPAQVYLIESKGLDVSRQKYLITRMHQKALELAGCLMIVALCEVAVEILSGMNHPEGDCPMCLYPLFPENTNLHLHPYMKLMSCYHCFHSACIIRWWKYIHEQKDENEAHGTNSAVTRNQRGNRLCFHNLSGRFGGLGTHLITEHTSSLIVVFDKAPNILLIGEISGFWLLVAPFKSSLFALLLTAFKS